MNIENYIYTEEVNECLECDFIADFYLQYKDECVCPKCKSKEYYIADKNIIKNIN